MILIKSDHPMAYKSGQWGQIIGETNLMIRRNGQVITRPCFDIMWPDGNIDVWPQVDPTANYQFKEISVGDNETSS